MSKWHKFEVFQFELAKAGFDLRDLYKQAYRWLKIETKGKWKITRLRGRGRRTTPIRPFLRFEPISEDRLVVSIKKQRDASLFKLYFSEHYQPIANNVPRRTVDHAFISILRKTVPKALAQSIVGVQPMTGIGVTHRYMDQSLSNNAIFGGTSPSQYRARRKRLKKKGVILGSIRLRLRSGR